MITPLIYNTERTVGVCEGTLEKPIYAGTYKASVLLEWAKAIVDNFGDAQVDVYASMNVGEKAHLFSACEQGDDALWVSAAGCEDEVKKE